MSGNEETSEESQVSAETGKERQATLAGGVGFLYLFKIVSLSFFPFLPIRPVSQAAALSPFEVLQPFSPLSINNKKRKLIASWATRC